MVWLVMSNETTRRSLAKLIVEKGYRVEEFECTDKVVPRMKFQQPSLVVVDCGAKDSFEMLDGVRTATTRRPVPVVMFSVDDQNVRARALAAGAHAYVPKGSLDWHELLAEIVRFGGPISDPPAE